MLAGDVDAEESDYPFAITAISFKNINISPFGRVNAERALGGLGLDRRQVDWRLVRRLALGRRVFCRAFSIAPSAKTRWDARSVGFGQKTIGSTIHNMYKCTVTIYSSGSYDIIVKSIGCFSFPLLASRRARACSKFYSYRFERVRSVIFLRSISEMYT